MTQLEPPHRNVTLYLRHLLAEWPWSAYIKMGRLSGIEEACQLAGYTHHFQVEIQRGQLKLAGDKMWDVYLLTPDGHCGVINDPHLKHRGGSVAFGSNPEQVRQVIVKLEKVGLFKRRRFGSILPPVQRVFQGGG